MREANSWAEAHPMTSDILSSNDLFAKSVATLKSFLYERFPSKSSKISTFNFDVELSELKQQDESFATYYKRVTSIMQRVGAKNRITETPLILFESTMLDTIMRAFLKDLPDNHVRHETTKKLIAVDKNLKDIYTLTEEARRIKHKLRQILNEKIKTKKLEILRSLIQKNMTKS